MNKHAPTKADLKFRLTFSLAGIALMVGGVFYRGMPQGPAFFDSCWFDGIVRVASRSVA